MATLTSEMEDLRKKGMVLNPSSVIPGLLTQPEDPVGDLTPYDRQAQEILSGFQDVINQAAAMVGKAATNAGKATEKDAGVAYELATNRTKFTWKRNEGFSN